MTRQKDAELAYSQIAALEQRARDAAARRTSLEESVAALAARSDACRAEIADIRQTRADSQTTIAQKEAEIREATQKRLARQQAETETLARARTAADSREEMSREMARLAERKAAAESEYDQTVAKLWMNISSRSVRPRRFVWSSTAARFAGTGGRPARQDPCAGQRERERH